MNASSPSTDRYAVVLTEPGQFSIPPLSKALAAFRGGLAADAVSDIRKNWGIMVRDVDAKDADRLVALLQNENIAAGRRPVMSLVKPREANELTKFEIDADGLTLLRDTRQPIPWAFVKLIAAAAIKTTTSRTLTVKEGPSAGAKLAAAGFTLATGIPVPMRRATTVKKEIQDADLLFVLDLFLAKTFLRLRFRGERVNYACLGDEKTMSAQTNFRLLLKKMATGAPHALLNRGARILLDGKPVTSMGYEQEEDLNHECSWLLTLLS